MVIANSEVDSLFEIKKFAGRNFKETRLFSYDMFLTHVRLLFSLTLQIRPHFIHDFNSSDLHKKFY